MELHVPRVVQRPRECEPACLAMALGHFGMSADMDALIRETASPQKFTDWEYLHGIAALRRGLHAYVFTADPWLYDPAWKAMPPPEWHGRFRQRADWVREEVASGRGEGFPWFFAATHQAAADFLNAGGEVMLRAPSRSLIAAVLDAGAPLIVPLWGSFFYGDRYAAGTKDDVHGMPYGHVVIVAGWEGGAGVLSRLLVVDPSPDPRAPGGRSWEEADDLLFASLSWTATVLVVSPRSLPAGLLERPEQASVIWPEA